MTWVKCTIAGMGMLLGAAGSAGAFGVFGMSTLYGGTRWDAAPRTVGGVERSLDGGLRYSLDGGSYEAYRDKFHWSGAVPTVADFQLTIESAFNNWTVVDPVSGYGTPLNFVYDPTSTTTDDRATGAEIDLLAYNFGNSGLRGNISYSSVYTTSTLTSGTTGYLSNVITGTDIRINTNPAAFFTLTSFRMLLTHEIGHTIGLDDADLYSGPFGYFVDDNYDGSTSQTALATLTNSFIHLIDPLDPSASTGLSFYTVANGDPGLDTLDVNILMESAIKTSFFAGAPTVLQNDDFAGRQFLYPIIVPEPAGLMLVAAAAMLLHRARRWSPLPPGEG